MLKLSKIELTKKVWALPKSLMCLLEGKDSSKSGEASLIQATSAE